jgi:predicted transcriptional regulator of viral defense system
MKLDLLVSSDLVVFTTRDFAQQAGISLAAASKRLARLAASNESLVQLTRGVWANQAHPHFSALACVPVLLGSEQGYVSFLTALHLHGAISQIPPNVQVATTGHARRAHTPVGTFEFFQLKPEMLVDGVVWSDTAKPYRIATVEKALLDTFYIATRKNRRFAKLPELSLADAKFNKRRYRALFAALALPAPIAAAMARRFEQVAEAPSRVSP